MRRKFSKTDRVDRTLWDHLRPKEEKPVSSMVSRLKQGLQSRKNVLPHLQIKAGAGCGKTTTLIEGIKYLKCLSVSITPSAEQQVIWDAIAQSRSIALSVCFCSFGKSIAKTLQERMPEGTVARTLHSLGYGAVKACYGYEIERNDNRVRKIIAELDGCSEDNLQYSQSVLLEAVKDLVSLCKLNLVPEEQWQDITRLDELTSYYDVDLGEFRQVVYTLVPQILQRCKDVERDGCIDADDMVWLPVVLNLPIAKYDLLLVDEAQDLNKCQQSLVKKIGRRIVFCGDPHQAIYGWAGADCDSMQRLRLDLDETKERCTTLSLLETRRCGQEIVKEANKYNSGLRAHASNPAGRITTTDMASYRHVVHSGDMILCRLNAPLVGECFSLLKSGHKAKIQGVDLGTKLIRVIKRLIKKIVSPTLSELRTALQQWLQEETRKERAKVKCSEQRCLLLKDAHGCMTMFVDNSHSIEEVVALIQSYFTDDPTEPVILLSSIHRAKGLERDRVFLLQPKGAKMPLPSARMSWQLEEERNLVYVSITRAIHEFFYVY